MVQVVLHLEYGLIVDNMEQLIFVNGVLMHALLKPVLFAQMSIQLIMMD